MLPLRSTVAQLEELAGNISLLKGDVEQNRAVAMARLGRHVWFHWRSLSTHRCRETHHSVGVLTLRSTVAQLEELAGKVTLLKGDIDQDRAVVLT